MKQGKILLTAAALVGIFMLAMNGLTRADDGIHSRDNVCPPGAQSCKIVVMTEQEIKSLEGPGLIFDSAEWANRANLSAAISAWKQKIANSPNGIVSPPAKKQDRLPQEKPKK